MRFLGAVYFRFFQPILAFGRETREETAKALRAARMGFFPEWYLALAWLAAASATVFLWVALAAASFTVAGPGLVKAFLTAASGLAGGALTYLGFLMYPRLKAGTRARLIDEELPNVITLCYALARGGVGVVGTFRAIADEEATYGEVSREFGLIVRDVDWFGEDLNSAIERTAETTPSVPLRRFLEGLVTVLNSGAAPRDYFRRHAAAQLEQAELRLLQEQEQAGLLAEAYVSGLLVTPLLLIVVLSVLASLGGTGARFLPFIVFGLIPLGTAGYLLLLDLMAPAEPLSVPRRRRDPLVDVGFEAAPEEGREGGLGALLRGVPRRPEDPPSLRRLFAVHALRARLRRWVGEEFPRLAEKPREVAQVAGAVGVAVLALGIAYVVFLAEGSRYEGGIALASVGLLASVLAALPVVIVHEWRVARVRALDAALPETLRKVAGFNERGITLLQAFQLIGKDAQGPLAAPLRRLDRDVAWTGNFRGALTRMAAAVGTRRMMKLGVLFERASEATGNLREVVDIAAADVGATESVRARRRQAMTSYVVVIYAVFAVFLYVLYMVTTLFFGDGGFAAAQAPAATAPGGGASAGAGLLPEDVRLLFFQGTLVQAACCGLVAGRLGEGHLLSGLKHAVLLGAVAWVVFMVGVV